MAPDAPVQRPGTGLGVLVINSMLHGGGVDAHTLAQCQALCALGTRVVLATGERARWLERARAIPGLELMVLRGRHWRWLPRLSARLRRGDLQVVHAHHGRDHWLAMAARAFALRPALRVVVTRHLMTPLKPATRRRLARHTRVVAVSDAVVASLAPPSGEPPLRLTRILCGIDTDAFRPQADPAVRAAQRDALGLPADALVFAVVGAIHAPDGKGQFHFVDAAPAVLARHPHAHFVCAGSGEAVPALQQRAAERGLGRHFHWRDFGDDMVPLMQAIDVLVHPAVGTEALGLVLLEAQACGRPVIGSRLDGIPETLLEGETGLLVPPRDVPALSAAMLQLAGDPALREQMGMAGRDWVLRHFTLDAMGRAMLQLYRDALAGPA